MISISNRLPSRQDFFTVFLVCIFITHVWAILIFLSQLPSYLLRMGAWDITGVFAYNQVFVLLESLLLASILAIVALVLPRTWFLAHFVTQAAILALIAAIWAIAIHLQDRLTPIWPFSQASLIPFWGILCLVVFAGLSSLLRRSSRFHQGLQTAIASLSFLSLIYLFVDLMSGLILVIRFIT
jgi:hypothetical protein